MLVLKIGDVKIPYEKIKNERYKRMSLRVTPEKVRVSAPKKVSDNEINKFIESNQKWILDNWLKFQEKDQKPFKRFYESGVKVPLLGKKLEIQINQTNKEGISARYDDERHIIAIDISKEVALEISQDLIQDVLKRVFKAKAKEIYRFKLDFWSQNMAVKYNQFRLKEQKTRWGSCSSLGNINLNWRAIMAPEAVVDYLIIHELAHLKHMDHSRAFWELVKQFCPDYNKYKTWLRENERNLLL